jgi:hypothetical protein
MDELTPVPDQLIEEALAQRPFAPLPPGFVDRVMAQIYAAQLQVTREVIRYRLELLDVALPILGACLFVLVLWLTGQLAFLGISTPITWSAVLPTLILPLTITPSPMTVLPLPTEWVTSNWLDLVGLLVFAEICVVALFCVWFWLDRPLSLTNGDSQVGS